MIFVFEVIVSPGYPAEALEEVRRIIREQAEFVEVRVIGEYEDPEWIVEPG